MRLILRSPGTIISPEVESTISQRLSHALDRLGHLVGEVQLTIRDENGPRGGNDKRCTLKLKLLPKGMLIVTKRSDDIRRALSLALSGVRSALIKRQTLRMRRRGRSSELAMGS